MKSYYESTKGEGARKLKKNMKNIYSGTGEKPIHNVLNRMKQLRIGIISVVIGGHFGGGDHFDGGDHFERRYNTPLYHRGDMTVPVIRGLTLFFVHFIKLRKA